MPIVGTEMEPRAIEDVQVRIKNKNEAVKMNFGCQHERARHIQRAGGRRAEHCAPSARL